MKTTHNQINRLLFWFFGVLIFASCKENIFQPEEFKTGVYFVDDSIDYSFGITPLEVESRVLELPLLIMGTPQTSDRAFQVEVVSSNTSAVQGLHFDFPSILMVPANSVNGVLPMTIYRSPLGDEDFKVTFRVVENENFTPANAELGRLVVTFNNRIEQPNWLDWSGQKAWPSSKLGVWNPLVYVKFMELFNEMDITAPNAYASMLELFGGPLLPDFPGSWAWDYDATLTKHVLIPLYRYFAIEHPELGVTTVPRPASFVD